ncbi:alpha/beta hydrolase fold domain-containing protein [Streptomyces sp. NL15-2K]|uniref:oxidoreductase n=1 Tax=Streptomyces sp. NL15-2K TaxID=376149 RepID=UPI000F56101D|nr:MULTISPECIES: alpha/beta hydrolase fold domain-containing protein [Actinomycetes]WKX15360.1 alpha/beta hydrolase fold domain-containing protein [Kutzneria buriramensis]GCB53204.1 oxidoreductase [Streptomyces sp. NL15-2K]
MLNALWNPIVAGEISLPHRLAMAPMTRDRSTPEGTPTELNAEYYAQRASHALIITEGTQPNADGQGYLLTPGIHSDEHIAGWRKVTDAVHGVDGRIVVQLMHVGRMSHPDNTPHHRQPVAPSPVQPAGEMFAPSGPQETPVPRELSTEEVAATVDVTDTRINLNRADLSGLPPTLVSWGTYEVLAGEDEEFAARVKDAGIDTTTVVVPGGQHSYVYGAGRIPETDAAIAQIGAWVREKTKI